MLDNIRVNPKPEYGSICLKNKFKKQIVAFWV